MTVGIDQNTSVQTKQPYKLTTKELETAFDLNTYDFGARQFDMTIGQWTSIDPLAEKYYGYSPYNFCMDNPAKYFDPNGKETWINYGKDQRVQYKEGKLYNQDGSTYAGKVKGFLKQSVNALNTIGSSKTGKEMLNALSSSKNVFDIKHVSANPSKQDEFRSSDTKKAHAEQIKGDPQVYNVYQKAGIDISGGSGGSIYWDPRGVNLNTTTGVQSSAETDLAHEMAHGYDADRGALNNTEINGLEQSEYNASYRENLIRGELNVPLRASYGTHDENKNPIQIPLLDARSQPILPS